MPARKFRHFSVTINNPTVENETWLRNCLNFAVKPRTQRSAPVLITFVIFQRERGSTEHFQCYFQLDEKVDPRLFTDKLEGTLGRRPHVEGSRGSAEHNLIYCSKEDSRVPGTEPFVAGDAADIPAIESNQGQRLDLEEVRADIHSGMSLRDLQEKHFAAFCKYNSYFRQYFTDYHQSAHLEQLTTEMSGTSLRPWQQTLVDFCAGAPDPRKVHWWWDPTGNKGKSWLARYLLTKGDWILVQMMKKADMCHLLSKQLLTARGVMFDLTRSSEQGAVTVVYEVIEMLKSRYLCSGKYDSQGLNVQLLHVIVFANYEPDRSAWSEDRYDVHKIL